MPRRDDRHNAAAILIEGVSLGYSSDGPGTSAAYRRLSRGLTLLETLVAMTILSSAIVGMTYALSQGSRAATHGIRQEHALELAENQLAMAVATGAASPIDEAGERGRFQWAITFEDKDHGLVLASVTVNWLEQGRPQSLSLSELYVPRALMAGEEAP